MSATWRLLAGDITDRGLRASRPRRVLGQCVSATLHAVLLFTIAQRTGRTLIAGNATLKGSNPIQVTSVTREELADPATPRRLDASGVDGDPDLHVGAFTFDIDRIARRRHLLFPFITGDTTFTRLERLLSDSGDRGGAVLSGTARASDRKPLALSARDIQAITDRTWSRRDRWKSFGEIRRLIENYDGDSGDVPVVMRSYLAQNILQPSYESSIPDPRLWVMLALSADHVDFIDFITTYAHDHPSTRTTTELLFLLDKFVQGNRDALVALVSVDLKTEAEFTRQARPDAFVLLAEIQQHYKNELAERGLVSPERILAHYDAARLRLLTAVITTSPLGYRVNDAKYLAGAVHWRAGNLDTAVRVWRTIRPAPDDVYYAAYLRVLEALESEREGSVDGRAITAALAAEDGRWLMTSFDRLRQFGYRFDTY